VKVLDIATLKASDQPIPGADPMCMCNVGYPCRVQHCVLCQHLTIF